MRNKDIIREMCADAFNQAMKSQPVLSKINIDYSNIKDGQYVARIEDDVAIPYSECLFIKDAKMSKTEE